MEKIDSICFLPTLYNKKKIIRNQFLAKHSSEYVLLTGVVYSFPMHTVLECKTVILLLGTSSIIKILCEFDFLGIFFL